MQLVGRNVRVGVGGTPRRSTAGVAQPGDDAVEVEDEHVGPEDVAAGHLMRFMRDAGRR